LRTPVNLIPQPFESKITIALEPLHTLYSFPFQRGIGAATMTLIGSFHLAYTAKPGRNTGVYAFHPKQTDHACNRIESLGERKTFSLLNFLTSIFNSRHSPFFILHFWTVLMLVEVASLGRHPPRRDRG
jgi:hypothetical protein